MYSSTKHTGWLHSQSLLILHGCLIYSIDMYLVGSSGDLAGNSDADLDAGGSSVDFDGVSSTFLNNLSRESWTRAFFFAW